MSNQDLKKDGIEKNEDSVNEQQFEANENYERVMKQSFNTQSYFNLNFLSKNLGGFLFSTQLNKTPGSEGLPFGSISKLAYSRENLNIEVEADVLGPLQAGCDIDLNDYVKNTTIELRAQGTVQEKEVKGSVAVDHTRDKLKVNLGVSNTDGNFATLETSYSFIEKKDQNLMAQIGANFDIDNSKFGVHEAGLYYKHTNGLEAAFTQETDLGIIEAGKLRARFYYPNLVKNLNAALGLKYKVDEAEWNVDVGAEYEVNDKLTMKGKVDVKKYLGLAIEYQLNESMKLTAAGKYVYKKDAECKYPFSFGINFGNLID